MSCKPSGKSCQKHNNKAVANFTKHLTAYMAVAVAAIGGHFEHLQ